MSESNEENQPQRDPIHPADRPYDGPSPAQGGAQPPFIGEIDAERLRVAEFFRQLLALTPTAWVTRVLLVAITAWFAVMALAGVDVFNPDADELIKYGANYGPVTLNGQWWRLFSCIFVHVGLIHFAFNMWALYVIGPLVERMVGHVGYLLLYFISGGAASFASIWFNRLVVAAGASGALFGLVGGLLGFLIRSRHSVPSSAFRGLRNQLVILIAINVALGFSISGIDNAAHLGGLAAGFVLGLILGQPIDEGTRVRRHWHNLATLVLGGGALAAAIAFALPPAPPAIEMEINTFMRNDRSYLNRMSELEQRLAAGQIDDAEFAESLQDDVIAPYRRVHDAIIDARPFLGHAPEETQQMMNDIERYAAARIEALQALLEWSQTKEPERIQKRQEFLRLLEEGSRIAAEMQ